MSVKLDGLTLEQRYAAIDEMLAPCKVLFRVNRPEDKTKFDHVTAINKSVQATIYAWAEGKVSTHDMYTHMCEELFCIEHAQRFVQSLFFANTHEFPPKFWEMNPALLPKYNKDEGAKH
jgi:hypothetical protein